MQVEAVLVHSASFEAPPAETPFGSPPPLPLRRASVVISAPLEDRFAPPSSSAAAKGLSYAPQGQKRKDESYDFLHP